MSRRLCFFVTLFLSVANFASAQVTVTTDPVGFTTTTLLGSSDTFVSIPFTRPSEFVGDQLWRPGKRERQAGEVEGACAKSNEPAISNILWWLPCRLHPFLF